MGSHGARKPGLPANTQALTKRGRVIATPIFSAGMRTAPRACSQLAWSPPQVWILAAFETEVANSKADPVLARPWVAAPLSRCSRWNRPSPPRRTQERWAVGMPLVPHQQDCFRSYCFVRQSQEKQTIAARLQSSTLGRTTQTAGPSHSSTYSNVCYYWKGFVDGDPISFDKRFSFVGNG